MTAQENVPERVAKFLARVDAYDTYESHEIGLRYKPGPTDVIISTAAKSGTTVLQQICHGLRSGGDMDFEEIGLVVPCLEMAHAYGYKDLYAPQPYQPQMFKTHFWYPWTPKGAGKYITVVRKPADTALSFYHFFEDWFFKKGEVSIEEFMNYLWFKIDTPRIPKELCCTARHIMSWYPHRFDKNVLWLHYEDLKQNRRKFVRLIAEFLDIGADDEALQDLVTKQSSIEFMKKHATKFDEHPLKYEKNEEAGLPRNAGLTGNPGKVRNGLSNGAKDVMPQYILDQIDAQWNEVVTTVTGYKTYEEFRKGINKELKRNFE